MNYVKPHILKYFKVENSWDINMVHRVNGKEKFERYLKDPNVHMFEIDVEDNGGSIKDITLQHKGNGDVSLTWAIKRLIKHNKALKLDLKLHKGNPYRSAFYSYALGIMRAQWDTEIPIWIHADVLKGPGWENSSHEYLDPGDFVQQYNSYYKDNPNATISLGHTTGYRKGTPVLPYTNQMLKEMRHITEGVDGPVTISPRYTNLMEYPKALQGLLKLGFVTVWNSEDRISVRQFDQLKEKAQTLNVFKDLTGLDGKPMWG